MAATAKQAPKHKVVAISVPFGLVWWNRELNRRKDYGKLDVLRASLRNSGWDFSETVAVEPIPDADVERAVKERQDRWADLKNKATGNPKEYTVPLQVFEALFTEKGKVVVPEHRGITGNRRSTAFEDAMVDRQRSTPPDPILPEIAIQLCDPKDASERLTILLRENELKTEGFLGMSDQDKIRGLFDLWVMAQPFGRGQQALRDATTGTTGQKAHGVFTIDKAFPGLELVDNLTREGEDTRFLPWGPIPGSKLPRILIAMDQDARDRWNRNAGATGKETIEPTDENKLREFFYGEKGPNAPKSMARKDMESIKKNNPNKAIQAIVSGVLNNTTAGLFERLVGYTQGMNDLIDMSEDGDYPPLEELLAELKKVTDRVATVNHLIDVIKGQA